MRTAAVPLTHLEANVRVCPVKRNAPRAWFMNGMAPFSFFNAVGSDPVYLVVSVGVRDGGAPKDTATNIRRNREFVVNLVTEELLAAMNVSAADFPPNLGELDAAGLHAAPSARISAPRLAEAQVSMECRLFESLPLGENTLFVGEVVMFHVADHLLGPRLRINHFAPVGRMRSPSMYCRTTDRFELGRISYPEWRKRREGD